jgi:hypothetical protein
MEGEATLADTGSRTTVCAGAGAFVATVLTTGPVARTAVVPDCMAVGRTEVGVAPALNKVTFQRFPSHKKKEPLNDINF